MKFKATKDQIATLGALAVNASVPVGLGLLHANDHVYTPEEILPMIRKDGLFLDYVGGRMTKLYIRQEAQDEYSIRDWISPEYQSWSDRYTVQTLLEAAGIQPEKRPQHRSMDPD
jgi:hypothetical protein